MAIPLRSISAMAKRSPLPVRMGYGWLKRKFMPHPIWNSQEFRRYYKWLRETEWWSRAELETFQLKQLKALVKHAYENVPYYRRVFDERRLIPDDISSLTDLQKIPLLTKEDLRNNFKDLIARNIDPNRLNLNTTGGTTGRPVALYVDKYTAFQRELAFIWRQWSWTGYRFGDSYVTLRGNVIKRTERNRKKSWWDYNTENNELVLSSFDMNEENMYKYVEMIRAFKPKFIQAYPSSLSILGHFMKRNGLALIKVKAIFLESETVYPWQRELLASQFDCEIFAAYGLTERAADAVECEHHQGLHVSMEYGILELVDKSNELITQVGSLGRVVGTGFDTYCMPFIRYATDDLAAYAANHCSCKRESTLIQEFRGRIAEFIVSRVGTKVPIVAMSCIPSINHKIREMQYIQKREGELIIKIAKASSFSEAEIEREFLDELRKRLDKEQFDLRIVFVDRVSRTGRGKLGILDQRLPLRFEDRPA